MLAFFFKQIKSILYEFWLLIRLIITSLLFIKREWCGRFDVIRFLSYDIVIFYHDWYNHQSELFHTYLIRILFLSITINIYLWYFLWLNYHIWIWVLLPSLLRRELRCDLLDYFYDEKLFTKILSIIILLLIRRLFRVKPDRPIGALLYLIAIVLSFSLLLLFLRIEFFALILAIVYIGAIIILFIFVIMMFDLRELDLKFFEPKIDPIPWRIRFLQVWYSRDFQPWKYVLLPLFIFFIWVKKAWRQNFVYFQWLHIKKIRTRSIFYIEQYQYNDIYVLSDLLFTQYAPLLIQTGFILFTAMLGTLILSSTKKVLLLIKILYYFQNVRGFSVKLFFHISFPSNRRDRFWKNTKNYRFFFIGLRLIFSVLGPRRPFPV